MALTGRLPLLLAAGLLPVLVRPQQSTVWLWLLVVVLLAAVDVLAAPRPRSLEVVRTDPPTTRLGEPTTALLEVRAARRARGVLRDAWQPTAGADGRRHRLRLDPGRPQRVRTELVPRRRGDLRALGVTVRLVGPLGLAARQATLDVPGRLRSLPAFGSRRHLPSRIARLRELDGRAAVRVRGQGTEFDSLRAYVRGDDIRSIDWRASARTRETVVRTWQPERDRRVVLLLDTSRIAAARVDDVPRLDSAMDAALLLAALASRAGDRVEVVAGDRRVRARLALRGTGDVAARLQESLADLEPELVEADWDRLVADLVGRRRGRALVVLLTPLEPASVEQGLLPVLPVLTRHHRVVVASVRDPGLARLAAVRDDGASVHQAAAAEQALARRARTAQVLGRLGVDVLDVDAEALPPALADHYLALKARGLL
ncbi:DUF58 domain-containing protein [Nocardioides sp.]|uniref:DUF58 domain-containing protein n=1 Tax=Nocardioides sp. TaxID=35761 RepID=UPI0035136236